jgi:chorismate-pyruvate lyase
MLRRYYDKRGFDQAYSAFKSKGYSEEWTVNAARKQCIAMETLPPFLRTLLVTDGTVTKSLEAYYWEPVRIETEFQSVVQAEADIEWLGVSEGDEVIARNIHLQGVQSGQIYAHALSIIRFDLIPDDLREMLLAGKLGIGELIRDCGLETYRELLEIEADDPGQTTTSHCRTTGISHGEQVYRTYRIILKQVPAILVTECFPVELYRGS